MGSNATAWATSAAYPSVQGGARKGVKEGARGELLHVNNVDCSRNCPGLSKFGTMSMARDGMTAVWRTRASSTQLYSTTYSALYYREVGFTDVPMILVISILCFILPRSLLYCCTQGSGDKPLGHRVGTPLQQLQDQGYLLRNSSVLKPRG